MLDKLPSDLLCRVVEYDDIRSRIRLASCNKFFERLVYIEGGARIWSEVRFDEIPRKRHTGHLTDARLDAFLTRIKAREVTKVFSLAVSYRHLSGRGLLPLAGSTVLEHIDLKPDTLRNYFIVRLLSSIVPSSSRQAVLLPSTPRLQRVVLPRSRFRDATGTGTGTGRRHLSDEDNALIEWKDQFYAASEHQIKLNRTKCWHCKEEIADRVKMKSSQIMGVCKCWSCEKFTCGEGSCPKPLICSGCTYQNCAACASTKKCSVCRGDFCEDCAKKIKPCSECSDLICEPCSESRQCVFCKKTFCEWCRQLSGLDCENCDDDLCVECYDEDALDHCYECASLAEGKWRSNKRRKGSS